MDDLSSSQVIRLTADRSERLDRFLSRQLPEFSRTKLARMVAEGTVLVDGKQVRPSFLLAQGMTVELPEPANELPHDLTPADIALDVRYEDEDLLVVNKPRGLAVHPAPSLKEPSLVNALLGRHAPLSTAGGAFRPGIVHRLDKETTGLIIVAKNDRAHMNLARQIEKKTAARRYLAVVNGEVPHEQFTVKAPLARHRVNRVLMAVDAAGKPAVTHFKKLAFRDGRTLLEAALETGRTHQIRVHLASLGYPVLGDRLYAPKVLQDCPLQLHAAFLSFIQPSTGATIEVYAEPPPDFFFAGVTIR